MKIISCNVNGIRAAYKKGLIDWIKKTKPDIVCLQEIKANKNQLAPDILNIPGYHTFINSALKKGYSGVLIYSKEKPLSIKKKLGFKRFDEEGRILKLKYKDLTIINLYFPHGGRKKQNLKYKLECYQHFFKFIKKIKDEKLILAGDFNIAHKEIDLARPKQNYNNIMFTPEERQQIDRLIKLGFVDSFRKFNKKGGHYTWWSYSYNARERNMGWRIDYTFISEKLTPRLKKAFILPEINISDHCPIGLKIEI